jgi:hypothetical protein
MKLAIAIAPDLGSSEAVVQLNLPVPYFATGVTLLAGALFGCAPAWQGARLIGLRIALGAQQRDVVLLILGDGMKLALAGVSIGLVGVVVLGHLMRSMLYGINTIDLGSFAAVALGLLAVAVLASYRRVAPIESSNCCGCGRVASMISMWQAIMRDRTFSHPDGRLGKASGNRHSGDTTVEDRRSHQTSCHAVPRVSK